MALNIDARWLYSELAAAVGAKDEGKKLGNI